MSFFSVFEKIYALGFFFQKTYSFEGLVVKPSFSLKELVFLPFLSFTFFLKRKFFLKIWKNEKLWKSQFESSFVSKLFFPQAQYFSCGIRKICGESGESKSAQMSGDSFLFLLLQVVHSVKFPIYRKRICNISKIKRSWKKIIVLFSSKEKDWHGIGNTASHVYAFCFFPFSIDFSSKQKMFTRSRKFVYSELRVLLK